MTQHRCYLPNCDRPASAILVTLEKDESGVLSLIHPVQQRHWKNYLCSEHSVFEAEKIKEAENARYNRGVYSNYVAKVVSLEEYQLLLIKLRL